jgi:hypothetical protein
LAQTIEALSSHNPTLELKDLLSETIYRDV